MLSIFLLIELVASELTRLEMGEMHRGVIRKNEWCEEFEVSVKEVGEVVIIGRGMGNSDPNIYVSSQEDVCESAEVVCDSVGTDVCTYSPGAEKMYVGVVCEYRCEYHLRVVEAEETEMGIDDERTLRLAGSEEVESSEVVVIRTPESVKDIEHVYVEVEFVNVLQVRQEFVAFVEAEGRRVESVDVVAGVKLVELNKHAKDVQLKHATEYRLVVEGVGQSEFTVRTYSFAVVRRLTLFQSVHDTVDYQEGKHYVFEFN